MFLHLAGTIWSVNELPIRTNACATRRLAVSLGNRNKGKTSG